MLTEEEHVPSLPADRADIVLLVRSFLTQTRLPLSIANFLGQRLSTISPFLLSHILNNEYSHFSFYPPYQPPFVYIYLYTVSVRSIASSSDLE